MQKIISAIYFDGFSSNPYHVELNVSSKYIEIIFCLDEKEIVLWEIDRIIKYEELNTNTYKLNYGNIPYQSIELDKDNYESLVLQNRNIAKATSHTWYEKFLKKKSLIFGLLFCVIAFCVFTYFVIIPAITPIAIKAIPMKTEVYLGEVVYKNMTKGYSIDSQKTEQINSFWKSMNYESKYPINITVVESDIVNAFALPGGRIVVFDTLLKILDNYSQLSALLSHEFIHIRNKHSMSLMVTAYSQFAIISLVFGNLDENIIGAIAQNASMLNTLKYSRNLEQEADLDGMILMQNANINTNGMYQLFEKLDEVNDVDSELLNYISTHPDNKKRIEYCKKFDKQNKAKIDNPKLDSIFKLIQQN
ncbi:MAG: M48 family metallopeptidase [Sphingobacteriales bacterium]|jgi:predicted Zn-dependent protease|nr:MAG: M48 family metallopeptidase [Sphingobacteriales bacterium]